MTVNTLKKTIKKTINKVVTPEVTEPEFQDYDIRRVIRTRGSQDFSISIGIPALSAASLPSVPVAYFYNPSTKKLQESGLYNTLGIAKPAPETVYKDAILAALQHGGTRNSIFRAVWSPTLGCDPEIFVTDSNNKVKPFHLALKYTPHYGKNIVNDGFAAEFTPFSKSCMAYLVDAMQEHLFNINNILSAYNTAHNTDWAMNPIDYLPVPRALRMTVPYEVVELGCKPSMNAYNDTVEFRNGIDTPYRTAGSHMHFGLSKYTYGNILKSSEAINELVRWIDAIAGVWSIALLPDQSPKRRKLYGRAGEYRLPSHGLEYRVHSSYIHSHPAIYHLMFEITRSALLTGTVGLGRVFTFNPSTVKSIINNCRAEEARQLIKDNKELYMGMLTHLGETTAQTAYDVSQRPKGLLEFINVSPQGVIDNWTLKPNFAAYGNRNGNTWVTHSEGLGKNWVHQAKIIHQAITKATNTDNRG